MSIIVRALIALLSLRKHAKLTRKVRKEERKQLKKDLEPLSIEDIQHTKKMFKFRITAVVLMNVIDNEEKSVDKFSKKK